MGAFSISGYRPGGGSSLTASAQTFLTTVPSGALIASLSKPFGPSTVYSIVSTVPQLAVNAGNIVAGSSAPTSDQSYSIKVRAQDAANANAIEQTLSFKALAPTLLTAPFTDANFPYQFYRLPNGTVTTTFDRKTFAPTPDIAGYSGTVTTYYVDIARSNDSGDGLSWATAKKSIVAAVQAGNAQANPFVIYVQAGTYPLPNGLGPSSTPTEPCALIAVNGRVETGMFTNLTWSLDQGSTYKATQADIRRALDLNSVDQDGLKVDLTFVSSLAACRSTPGSWWTDNVTVYVNRADGSVVTNTNSRALQMTGNSAVVRMSNGGNMYLSGFDVVGGFLPLILNNSPTNRFVAEDCTFRYSSGDDGIVTATKNISQGGVAINDVQAAAFIRCDASSNQSDGFNSHIANAKQGFVFTLDCSGYNNGRAGSTSNNVFTTHDGGRWIDLRGKAYRSYGANYAIANDSTAMWVIDGQAGDSRSDAPMVGTSPQADYGVNLGTAKMYLTNCVGSSGLWASAGTIYQNGGSITGPTTLQNGGLIVDSSKSTYLPGSPTAAMGFVVAVEGYAGPLAVFRRPSDGATQAFSAGSDGWINAAAVSAWTGGANPYVVSLYDQVSGTVKATQATTGNQPLFDLENPRRGMICASDGVQRYLVMAGPIARRNVGLFCLTFCTASNPSLFCLTNGSSANYEVVQGGPPMQSFSSSGGTVQTAVADEVFCRSGMQAFGFVGSTASRLFLSNDKVKAAAANTIDANAELLWIGQTLSGSMLKGGQALIAIYPAIAQADALAVTAALQTIGGVKANYDRRVVFAGDSITFGQGANLARSTPALVKLAGIPEVINLGVPNTLMSAWDTNYAAQTAPYYTSKHAKAPVLVINPGTNDIYANASAATIYAAATSLIAKAKASGFKVVIETLLPTTRNSAGQNTEAANYNALVRANSAGADAVADIAAHPTMGAAGAAANTTLYGDGLHPTDYGYSLLEPTISTAIETAAG